MYAIFHPFVVTEMDKQVIEQYKLTDQMNCLRRTFLYWKKTARLSQQARYMSKTFALRRLILNMYSPLIMIYNKSQENVLHCLIYLVNFCRCLLAWNGITSFRAQHRKKMEAFKTKHTLTKVGY